MLKSFGRNIFVRDMTYYRDNLLTAKAFDSFCRTTAQNSLLRNRQPECTHIRMLASAKRFRCTASLHKKGLFLSVLCDSSLAG